VADEADHPAAQQAVQRRPGGQLELPAERALKVDVGLNLGRPVAHNDAIEIAGNALRHGYLWRGP
jgi:hypothetical protein